MPEGVSSRRVAAPRPMAVFDCTVMAVPWALLAVRTPLRRLPGNHMPTGGHTRRAVDSARGDRFSGTVTRARGRSPGRVKSAPSRRASVLSQASCRRVPRRPMRMKSLLPSLGAVVTRRSRNAAKTYTKV